MTLTDESSSQGPPPGWDPPPSWVRGSLMTVALFLALYLLAQWLT